ncbi:tripartite motif-containing protein 65 isoform X2 [Canis lupus familiaris]|uniref:E3 ubiquitin-protein ligase TRIM65 n=3 Tax=Canis lupus TaxID=9612 RepID=A0A8P0N7N4_CANLF|nr:tripartite motif-containing protein 65 isoform X2 [Canis lupus dingo]XP_038402496.1 tripartite motif-containing protein 65 isoform X2 [Canis lupus familiaris]XP_038481315.1 tripartite motif-containing protein 65 isoform X2 [Canis lupus familiaris]XP_038531619.1 tripartite motif-containing protein 65 isoform X2 [Canis lupus familiaris]
MAAHGLEDKLTCSICLGLFQEPVTLPCGHNFCRACIRDWGGRCDKACPECREPFPDVAELRRNVALSAVLEVMRARPAPAPGSDPAATPGAAPAPGPGPGARCPRHGRPLDLFCRTEGLCVCSACTVNECRLHERALLDVERREREAQLRAMLEVTQQQATQAESQLEELQRQSSQIQSSAHTLASAISGKFSCLLQALEMRRALALEDIKAAKTQALAQAQDTEQQLRSHLEALSRYDRRVRDVLEHLDDRTFLQESQLLAPPGPLRPLTPLRWDGEQRLASLKESLSRLCGLLLDEGGPCRAPVEAANLGPVDYRNLTFDPDSANRHLYLSRQDQQVKHRHKPRDLAGPSSFELWQVQCAQSFQSGRHYWEVRASNHSVTLGVAYPELTRRKQGPHTDNIGRGPSSWGLCVQEDRAQAWHNGEAQHLPGVSGRLLGMDLDLASGCLTFYSLEPKAQPLHTFHAIFTQPLYPVFWLLEGRTLTLCHRPQARLPPELQEEASSPAEEGTG